MKSSQSVKVFVIIAAVAAAAGASLFIFMGPSVDKSFSPSSAPQSVAEVSTISTDKQDNAAAEEEQLPADLPYQQVLASSALECRLEKSADSGHAAVSAKLVDKDSREGIADRQLLVVVMPGNPVAESLTDNSGQAQVSIDLSEFDSSQSMLIFFDGDDRYDFSSCEIHLESI